MKSVRENVKFTINYKNKFHMNIKIDLCAEFRVSKVNVELS